MKDYYLKFSNQEEARRAFFNAGFEEYPDAGMVYPDTAIHVIGTMSRATDEIMMVDGEPLPVVEVVEGWHINVRAWGDNPPVFPEEFCVNPVTPAHVWF